MDGWMENHPFLKLGSCITPLLCFFCWSLSHIHTYDTIYIYINYYQQCSCVTLTVYMLYLTVLIHAFMLNFVHC
jgi:hypothetical protein